MVPFEHLALQRTHILRVFLAPFERFAPLLKCSSRFQPLSSGALFFRNCSSPFREVCCSSSNARVPFERFAPFSQSARPAGPFRTAPVHVERLAALSHPKCSSLSRDSTTFFTCFGPFPADCFIVFSYVAVSVDRLPLELVVHSLQALEPGPLRWQPRLSSSLLLLEPCIYLEVHG